MMAKQQYGNATAMAGEFLVMEKLYRLGYQPALTVGCAKSIDILVENKRGSLFQISVKSVRGGGKWGVPGGNLSAEKNMVFAFVRYRDFDDLMAQPDVFVIPARDVQRLRAPWFDGFAVYYTPKSKLAALEKYRNAWRECLE